MTIGGDNGTVGVVLEFRGKLDASGRRYAIVVSRFNEFVTSKLLEGALDALRRHGAADDGIAVIHVPGAFEIPQVAKKLAESHSYDAIICLGCVIRGATPHFEFVAGEASHGIAQVGTTTGVPTAFGVITADTMEQALDRAGAKGSNKGVEAALTAIELANLIRTLPAPE